MRADMSCRRCHLARGTTQGGSFVGIYGRFPQWNKRAQRVIALQDRIAECFLYSMNGKAPGLQQQSDGRRRSLYRLAFARNAVGAEEPAADRYIEPLPSASPDPLRGAGDLCAQSVRPAIRPTAAASRGVIRRCGAALVQLGAGMAHIDRMTGFVRYNMPQNAPGTLSLEQAYDVAAFVLGHPRPRFGERSGRTMPPQPAKYFSRPAL